MFNHNQYVVVQFTAFMLCYTQDDASAEGGMYAK